MIAPLPIATLRNASGVLAAAKEIDPAVSSIQVFHPTGIVVHTTSEDTRAPIPKELLLLQSLSPGDRWTAENESELLTGQTLRNLQGKPIGGVVVAAANRDFKARSRAMAIYIASAAGIVFLAFSGLALLILRLRLDGAIKGLGKLEGLSREFSDDRTDTERSTAPEAAGQAEPGTVQFGFLSGEIVRLEGLLGRLSKSSGWPGKSSTASTRERPAPRRSIREPSESQAPCWHRCPRPRWRGSSRAISPPGPW